MSDDKKILSASAGVIDDAVIDKALEANGIRSTRKFAEGLPFYESMTQAVHLQSGARIRVWRRESELPKYQDIEILEILSQIPATADMESVIGVIETLPRITAIELVDGDGNGAIKYLEW